MKIEELAREESPNADWPIALHAATQTYDVLDRKPGRFQVIVKWFIILLIHIETGGSTVENYKIIQPEERKWDPHPQLPGIEVAYLLSNRTDNVDITCALVHLPVGAQVEKHLHEQSDDIIYVLQGKAKMWVEGRGDVPLAAGSFLRIPKGTWHQPHDIEEDFVAYDTWYPALA